MTEPMSEERLAELEALDRGPCLPAVAELVAEVKRLRDERDWLRLPGTMRLAYRIGGWIKNRSS